MCWKLRHWSCTETDVQDLTINQWRPQRYEQKHETSTVRSYTFGPVPPIQTASSTSNEPTSISTGGARAEPKQMPCHFTSRCNAMQATRSASSPPRQCAMYLATITGTCPVMASTLLAERTWISPLRGSSAYQSICRTTRGQSLA